MAWSSWRGRISTGLSRPRATLRRARARRRCGCSRASCCARSSIWRNTWRNAIRSGVHVPRPPQGLRRRHRDLGSTTRNLRTGSANKRLTRLFPSNVGGRVRMFQDLRYGLRLMVRRPGFAAVAVATLALGIGTTTAIFAVTDRVLLRPVPYADPERLAVIWETPPNHPLPIMYASPPNLHEWQVRSQTVAAMGGFQWRDVTLGGSDPERIRGARLTAGLLPALGVQPQIGRLFLPEEDRAGGRPVVLISDAPVAPPLPAGSRHSRPHGSDRRRANGNHRRDAAGLRVPARRRAARPRAGGARGTVGAARHQSRNRSTRRALPRGDRPLAPRRVIRRRRIAR